MKRTTNYAVVLKDLAKTKNELCRAVLVMAEVSSQLIAAGCELGPDLRKAVISKTRKFIKQNMDLLWVDHNEQHIALSAELFVKAELIMDLAKTKEERERVQVILSTFVQVYRGFSFIVSQRLMVRVLTQVREFVKQNAGMLTQAGDQLEGRVRGFVLVSA